MVGFTFRETILVVRGGKKRKKKKKLEKEYSISWLSTNYDQKIMKT